MTGVELHWPHSQLSMISLFETKPCSAHGRAQLMFWSRASPFHHTNTQCRGGCAPHIRQWKRVWGQNPTTSAGGTPLLSKIVHGKKKCHMVQGALVRTINSSDIFFPLSVSSNHHKSVQLGCQHLEVEGIGSPKKDIRFPSMICGPAPRPFSGIQVG